MLNENFETFVIYMISLNLALVLIHLDRKT